MEFLNIIEIDINDLTLSEKRNKYNLYKIIGKINKLYYYNLPKYFDISDLDVYEYDCSRCNLTDLSNYKLPNSLKVLKCSHNKITNIKLPDSLIELNCSFNNLSEFGNL